MRDIRHFKVPEDDNGQRLDRWIKKNVPDLAYGITQKLIRKGQIRIDGKRAKPDTKLEQGQEIRIPMPDAKEISRKNEPEKRKLTQEDIAFMRSLVIYEDEDIIAINKPQGLAVQGGTNTKRHIDGMLDAFKTRKGVTPRLVHRLDKDTSGVLLLARSANAARALGKAFKSGGMRKIYWALVSPTPEVYQGTIKAPLAKASSGSQKERVHVDEEEGKFAITEYTVIENAGNDAAFVAFWPRTGRTHQIRVHAQTMGSAIIGDGKYKGEKYDNNDVLDERLASLDALGISKNLHLHARRLILKHPIQKRTLDITAPLPEELEKSWKNLGFNPHLKDDPFEDIN